MVWYVDKCVKNIGPLRIYMQSSGRIGMLRLGNFEDHKDVSIAKISRFSLFFERERLYFKPSFSTFVNLRVIVLLCFFLELILFLVHIFCVLKGVSVYLRDF